jgi:hypothetical protein
LLIATFLTPHVAVGAITQRKAPERVAVSTEVLAGLWGGSTPATHIGETGQYGMLTVTRTDFSCPGDYIATNVVPTNGGRCNQSIPFFLSNEDVELTLGGDAANLSSQGHPSPNFQIYVNGTAVPASQLGSQFQVRCPQLDPPWGTATVNGIDLSLYSCSGGNGGNTAVIPLSFFRQGLNTIAARYAFSETSFAQTGDTTSVRIIYHQ